MNGEMVAKALRQVEMSEAGLSEAEVLRQALGDVSRGKRQGVQHE